MGECLLDTQCGETEKCCYYGCNFTCKAALSTPGKIILCNTLRKHAPAKKYYFFLAVIKIFN